MLKIGPWRIASVVTGHVRLDGGAMFGVVPRVLWEKAAPPDEQHRILLATRTLLALHERASRLVLVDTGTGSKWPAELAERYGVTPIAGALDTALADIGAGPDDVTDLVVTHLHFDHAGGMTDWADQPGGATRLRFPRARHWITPQHRQHANHPTLRDRASFFPHDFAELERANVLAVVDDPGERPAAIPDLRWQVSNGHTPGQLLPRFAGGASGPDLLFVGDLVPTSAHLPPTWVMAYDLWPLTTLDERLKLYAQCRQEEFLLAFPHDPERGIVSLEFDKDRPRVSEVLG
jgi:glyoxylase-like metal-dependent hydrolase (beta-lactamase superfamily II)